MAVTKETTIKRFIGLSSDTKPTHARFVAGTDSSDPEVGSTFYEYDTGEMYITYDGTNWVPKISVSTGGLITKVSSTKINPANGNAYAASQVVSNSETAGTAWTFANMTLTNAGKAIIIASEIVAQATNITPRFVLDLYSTSPSTVTNDHVASTGINWADKASYLGTIDYPALQNVGTGASYVMITPSTYGGLPIPFNTTTGDMTVYGILKTRDIFTPIANNSITINMILEQLT